MNGFPAGCTGGSKKLVKLVKCISMSIKNDKSKLSLSLTATEAKWLVNLLERHASDRKEVARKSPSPGSSHQESAYNDAFTATALVDRIQSEQ